MAPSPTDTVESPYPPLVGDFAEAFAGLMPVSDAARAVGIPRNTLAWQVSSGKMPGLKLGHTLWVRLADAETFKAQVWDPRKGRWLRATTRKRSRTAKHRPLRKRAA